MSVGMGLAAAAAFAGSVITTLLRVCPQHRVARAGKRAWLTIGAITVGRAVLALVVAVLLLKTPLAGLALLVAALPALAAAQQTAVELVSNPWVGAWLLGLSHFETRLREQLSGVEEAWAIGRYDRLLEQARGPWPDAPDELLDFVAAELLKHAKAAPWGKARLETLHGYTKDVPTLIEAYGEVRHRASRGTAASPRELARARRASSDIRHQTVQLIACAYRFRAERRIDWIGSQISQEEEELATSVDVRPEMVTPRQPGAGQHGHGGG